MSNARSLFCRPQAEWLHWLLLALHKARSLSFGHCRFIFWHALTCESNKIIHTRPGMFFFFHLPAINNSCVGLLQSPFEGPCRCLSLRSSFVPPRAMFVFQPCRFAMCEITCVAPSAMSLAQKTVAKYSFAQNAATISTILVGWFFRPIARHH